jgi:putative SOS response-associated peptidase YedK
MCGRYAYYAKIDDIITSFEVDQISDETIREMKNFNVAPTNKLPVIYEFGGKRILRLMQFKLVSHKYTSVNDVKEYCRFTQNAKSESIFDLSTWERPIRRSRCIIPMNSFYEFQKSPKQVFSVYQKKNSIQAAAGIFDFNENIYTDPLYSFAIITIASTERFMQVHHRQPVFLEPSQYSQWLDRKMQNVEEIQHHFKQVELNWHKVSNEAGKVSNNHSELLNETD